MGGKGFLAGGVVMLPCELQMNAGEIRGSAVVRFPVPSNYEYLSSPSADGVLEQAGQGRSSERLLACLLAGGLRAVCRRVIWQAVEYRRSHKP